MDQSSKEKKLFFFGQPGCLKVKFDIPIRPSEDDSQKTSNADGNSENKQNDEENSVQKAEVQSDDDSQELLKKIDAVLEEDSTSEHQQKDQINEISIQNASQTQSELESNENNEQACVKEVLEKKESESALENTFSASIEKEMVKTDDINSVENIVNDEKCKLEEFKQNELVKENINESIDKIPSNETESNEIPVCDEKSSEESIKVVEVKVTKAEENTSSQILSNENVTSLKVTAQNIETSVTNESEPLICENTNKINDSTQEKELSEALTNKQKLPDSQEIENTKPDSDIIKVEPMCSKLQVEPMEIIADNKAKENENFESQNKECTGQESLELPKAEQMEPTELLETTGSEQTDTESEKNQFENEVNQHANEEDLSQEVPKESPMLNQDLDSKSPLSQSESQDDKVSDSNSESKVKDESSEETGVQESSPLNIETSNNEVDSSNSNDQKDFQSEITETSKEEAEISKTLEEEGVSCSHEQEISKSEVPEIQSEPELPEPKVMEISNEMIETSNQEEISHHVMTENEPSPPTNKVLNESPHQEIEKVEEFSAQNEELPSKVSEHSEEPMSKGTEKNEDLIDVSVDESNLTEVIGENLEAEVSQQEPQIESNNEEQSKPEEPLTTVTNKQSEEEAHSKVMTANTVHVLCEDTKSEEMENVGDIEDKSEINESNYQIVEEANKEKIDEPAQLPTESDEIEHIKSPKEPENIEASCVEHKSETDQIDPIEAKSESKDATHDESSQLSKEVTPETEESFNDVKVNFDKTESQPEEACIVESIPQTEELSNDQNQSTSEDETKLQIDENVTKLNEISESPVTEEPENIEPSSNDEKLNEPLSVENEQFKHESLAQSVNQAEDQFEDLPKTETKESLQESLECIPQKQTEDFSQEQSGDQNQHECIQQDQSQDLSCEKEESMEQELPNDLTEKHPETVPEVCLENPNNSESENFEELQEIPKKELHTEKIIISSEENADSDTADSVEDISMKRLENENELEKSSEIIDTALVDTVPSENVQEENQMEEPIKEIESSSNIPQKSIDEIKEETEEIQDNEKQNSSEIGIDKEKFVEMETLDHESDSAEKAKMDSVEIEQKIHEQMEESTISQIHHETPEDSKYYNENISTTIETLEPNIKSSTGVFESTSKENQEVSANECSKDDEIQLLEDESSAKKEMNKIDENKSSLKEMQVVETLSKTDNIVSDKVESPVVHEFNEESDNFITEKDEKNIESHSLYPMAHGEPKHETATGILITDVKNLNEKIDDSQVELSKNDNKSSTSEKSSTLDNFDNQNQFSNDSENKQQLFIKNENQQDIKDNEPVLQSINKSNETRIEKVELQVAKQYDPVVQNKREDNLHKSDVKEAMKLEEMVLKESHGLSNQEHQITVKSVDTSEQFIQLDTKTVETSVKIDNGTPINTQKEINDSESNIQVSEITKPSKNLEKSELEENFNETNADVKERSKELHENIKKPIEDQKPEDSHPPVDPLHETPKEANDFDSLLPTETKLDSIPITKSCQRTPVTRKRKLTERKSISESDSDGGSHFITDSMSNDNPSDEEETVASKKPRIRNKITATRNTRATRQSARGSEPTKSSPESKEEKKTTDGKEEQESEEKTLQNIKFDYDENEDVAANIAAIKTLICKDPPKKEDDDDSNESSADESTKKKPLRRGRKGKRGRTSPKKDSQESSSDESKSAKMHDTKRSKTSESEDTTDKQTKKKRNSGGKGLLKYIDTNLVIDTVEAEAPIRQSRRIAQQKIREETERRQMEEKMLKQMKEEAERKKKLALIPEPPDEKDDSSDESYQDSRKKKKKKLKPSDKPWQTSSSHSEHSESEDEFERPPSEDPGSPLFRSDHEFSPESDVDDTPVQPVKRARTAKKQVEESSSDDEDVNPNHACQVCHKTDCPEWILLCDECDHGYHCSCLKPIIFCIPSGNWYCPLCCHKKLIDNLTTQLDKLDTLITNIKTEELRQQKQLEIKKLTEITEENILREKRKKRAEMIAREEHSRESRGRNATSDQESDSNDDDDSSDNSSDNEPLNEIFYKLRRRNQTNTSYRFNDYDDLINSAIRDEMEEVKGMGNAGRGKDISTIIEADKEEKKMQKLEKEKSGDEHKEKDSEQQEGEESSGSDIVRPKKAIQRKKKNRKLNNLDETSEEDQASDEDFKGSGSTNSDTEEEYSISGSVSESSLDLPLKKSKTGQRSTRSAARNRRYDETFIDDNSSDDEPLIKKRTKKQIDSDEEDFDANDDDNSTGSTAEDIDSEDLCDDTDTDESSESNWPKKKKKKVAQYDIKKPRKPAKKSVEGNDKAFRAGISKKNILKQSDHESEQSDNESVKGRRRTRGKKLLYLIEDDYESDDGIKPGIGVVRPETPPEERELFVKKQEEIKRMLAEKNTEAARQLAVPTIEPLKFSLEKPISPSPPPLSSSELASLSTIPKNVIEGAKALDMDYNKIKTIHYGAHSKASEHPSAQDMSEEDLARMMEEEDFAQHQLRLVGESIERSKLLQLEVKEEAFAGLSKANKLKEETELEKTQQIEGKKRAKKIKTEKQASEASPAKAQLLHPESAPKAIPTPAINTQSAHLPINIPTKSEQTKIPPHHIPSIPPLIPGAIPHHSPYPNLPQRFVGPSPHNLNPQDRPSVLSSYIPRHESIPRLEPPRIGELRPRFEAMPPRLEGMPPGPQHLRFPPVTSESFLHKAAPIMPSHPQPTPPPPVAAGEEVEEKKKGRRKKYTPLRTDLPESNVSKVAKLDTLTTSVIQSTANASVERVEDKNKMPLPPTHRTKPLPGASEIFNPTTSSSVITRLLQPQQRPPFGGFVEQMAAGNSPNNPNQPPSRPFPEDMKHHPLAKQVRPPQAQFAENPFVPRGMHSLYRGPPTSQPSIYGIPSHHARIPYPFHHLHPNNNLRPNMQEYGAPYNIPPQFGYYAPPAHSRHPSNPAAGPPIGHPDHPDAPPNSARPNPDEPSESSEFGGLVSYFSSQQELD